ncbi:MAG TPA: tRNA pseudouridine(55) synthase TruB [Bacteroidota bacterium]|nr:tRNA pseudouridine(55) synthase TruB [Bacteroidota bacterium]
MEPSREFRFADGEMLLVRKPAGWTSFDVVHKIRRLFGVKKVGHAGTLDPLATGLLIVCTGKKTRAIAEFVGLEKEYLAEMTLGGRTESFDTATPVIAGGSTEGIDEERILGVFAEFTGPRLQVPPMWSAVSVKGKRLYRYAREGVEVKRDARDIMIHSIVPVTVSVPVVRFRVTCSKGTYIRSLVSEMGDRLGCGAYLTALERTRIGPYRVEDAVTIEDLAAYRASMEPKAS